MAPARALPMALLGGAFVGILLLEGETMAESLMKEPTGSEAVELRDEFDRVLAEIDELRAKMQRDDEEIERSRARTQARLAELQALFAKW